MKCLRGTPLFLFLFLSLFLLPSVLAGALFAQEPVITPETRVDYGILHQWLHSS
jgi:hypothetical protein